MIVDRWVPDEAADIIARHGVTLVGGTPFHVARLLDLVERTRRLDGVFDGEHRGRVDGFAHEDAFDKRAALGQAEDLG